MRVVNKLFIRADPEGAARGIPIGREIVDDGGHLAVGGHAADAVVAGIEEINGAVGKDEEAVHIRELKARGRGRAVAVEAAHMGAGEGVDEAVGGDFQNGLAGLVGDKHVAVGVGTGHVRVGQADGAGHRAFVSVRPKIDRDAVRAGGGGVGQTGQGQRGAEAGGQIGEVIRRDDSHKCGEHRAHQQKAVQGEEGKFGSGHASKIPCVSTSAITLWESAFGFPRMVIDPRLGTGIARTLPAVEQLPVHCGFTGES